MECLGSLLPVGSVLLLVSAVAQGGRGVAHVESETWSKDYCILFSPDYVTLPRDLHHAPLLPLHDGTRVSWCPGKDPSLPAPPSLSRQQALYFTIAMAMVGNCSFHDKGWLAQGRGAHGLLIVSRSSDPQGSDTSSKSWGPRCPLLGLTVAVAVLRYADMLDILRHTHGAATVRMAMYAPPEPVIDYNLVVIFLLAVGTVAVGGYWAGMTEAAWLQRHQARGGGGPIADYQPQAVAAKRPPRDHRDEGNEDCPVDFTLATASAAVSVSCSTVVLLYFFYDSLVYVMIGIFSLGAGTGLYSCLVPLMHHLLLRQCQRPLPGHQASLRLPRLLLAGLCALVTLLWVAYRNEDRWAWLLQDVLGMAYCLFVLRQVQLPTFKDCTCFLLAVLAFDVFFVFVTPLFTYSGESIMLEVALGPADSSSHERLPMVLKVPRLRTSALTPCDQPFSILGFGDIVVPGFLVVYCHRFDVHVHSPQVYFVACTIAYAMGLMVTFMAMILMEMGQPALLYLVSSTLLTSLAVAAYRQELTLFWSGLPRCQISQPVTGVCFVLESCSKQRQEGTTDSHTTREVEGATDQEAGDSDSNSGEDTPDMVTISEEDTTSQEGYSEDSEGWDDIHLDPEDLPPASSRAAEDLRPLTPAAMLIPLTPRVSPPSKLGHIPAQAQAQARDTSPPCLGLHRRKDSKVKRCVSMQAPL